MESVVSKPLLRLGNIILNKSQIASICHLDTTKLYGKQCSYYEIRTTAKPWEFNSTRVYDEYQSKFIIKDSDKANFDKVTRFINSNSE